MAVSPIDLYKAAGAIVTEDGQHIVFENRNLHAIEIKLKARLVGTTSVPNEPLIVILELNDYQEIQLSIDTFDLVKEPS